MASVMIPADVGLELETGVALAANADFHRIEFTAADHEGLGSRLFAESDLSLSWQQKVVETGHRAVVQVGRRCPNAVQRPRSIGLQAAVRLLRRVRAIAAALDAALDFVVPDRPEPRSEERRVGKEWVSQWR